MKALNFLFVAWQIAFLQISSDTETQIALWVIAAWAVIIVLWVIWEKSKGNL